MDLRASACRGAARVKAVRAPRVAGSGATPRRPAPRGRGADPTGTGRRAVGGAGETGPALILSAVAPGVADALGVRGRAVFPPPAAALWVRGVPAHPLQERQLTQAPGARADVTLRHVCGRPGALGLAEPPWEARGAPPGPAGSAGAVSCWGA